MLTSKQLELLACFFPKLENKTAKELEKATGFSHEPAFRLLKELVKDRYLKEKKVGKTKVYSFIFTDETYLVYCYFMTKKISSFKRKHSLLYKRLKEFSDLAKASCIVLFGSYAKGTEQPGSDIDLLCIGNKSTEPLAATFKTKYDIVIRPVIIKQANFKDIKTDNPAFYSDLVEFGIVLKGTELFFKEVYGGYHEVA